MVVPSYAFGTFGSARNNMRFFVELALLAAVLARASSLQWLAGGSQRTTMRNLVPEGGTEVEVPGHSGATRITAKKADIVVGDEAVPVKVTTRRTAKKTDIVVGDEAAPVKATTRRTVKKVDIVVGDEAVSMKATRSKTKSLKDTGESDSDVKAVKRVKKSASTDNGIVQSNQLFYPTLEVKITDSMTEDEKLYNLFLQQISSKYNDNIDIFPESNDIGTIKAVKKIPLLGSNALVETPIDLVANVPIEYIHKNRLMFGNFIEFNTNKSKNPTIKVRQVSGDVINIDVSQIISIWEVLADETVPTTSAEWAQTAAEALQILGNMAPRKSDLNEFWQLIIKRRGLNIPVDSLDLGVYIFQERNFNSWIDPLAAATASGVRALSSSQRYAASLLLYNDDFHFKRRSTAYYVDENQETTTSVIEGAYRPLDEGISMFKEGEAFINHYETTQSGVKNNEIGNPYREGIVTRQLRAIEVFAMSTSKAVPPPIVKHLLKKLNREQSPQGAMSVLKDLNIEFERSASPMKSTSITPWSESVLKEANSLNEELAARRVELTLSSDNKSKVGKKGPSGRMEYRSATNPPICIDSIKATFLDDAFSLSPETGEILVHVVDVMGTLRRYDALNSVAKDRLFTTFLPSGPLHMLPPQALEGLKLSSKGPNEVITCAISVDDKTGKLIGFRVFPSIIGPVFAIDSETADDIIQMNSNGVERRVGYPTPVIRDLVYIQQMMAKVIETNPWIDQHFSKNNDNIVRNYYINKRTGVVNQDTVEKTPCTQLVNALLTLYSNATLEYIKDKNLAAPIIWENRDRADTSLIRRFGTQPLRHWIAQLQQRQIRAALKLELPLQGSDCAIAVSYYKNKKTILNSISNNNNNKAQLAYESLESRLAAVKGHDSTANIVFDAEGVGKGGLVRLAEYPLTGLVNNYTFSKGEKVKVMVKSINSASRSLLLDKL